MAIASVLVGFGVFLGLGGSADAQRVVAVIDATRGGDLAVLDSALIEQVDQEADDVLVGVPPERRAALIDEIPDEDLDAMTDAAADLPRARDALTRFDDKAAISHADAGLARAMWIAPTPELVLLVADLAFTRGLALLGRDVAGAERDFALVQRLDPTRTLNPVQYLPEVLAAFARAGATATTAVLDVVAPEGAEVWVDGAAVGPAPAAVTLAVGLHCVTVTGERLVTRGQLVDVPAAGGKVTLDADEAAATVITHRLRRRLIEATTEDARNDAVHALVRLAGGQDAIVVGRDDTGGTVVWLFSGRTSTLGTARTTEGKNAEELIKLLRPPKITPPRDPCLDAAYARRHPVECPGPTIIPPPPPPKLWYQKRWVQATIGGTLLVGVVTTVVAVMAQDPGESAVIIEMGELFPQ